MQQLPVSRLGVLSARCLRETAVKPLKSLKRRWTSKFCVATLIPGRRPPQVFGETLHRFSESSADCFWVLPSGSGNNITYRDRRSTRVPIAVCRLPIRRSPSQCPGTARSSTSSERSEIITMSRIWPLVDTGRPWGASCGPSGTQTTPQLRTQRTFSLDEQ